MNRQQMEIYATVLLKKGINLQEECVTEESQNK